MEVLELAELDGKNIEEVQEIAKEFGIDGSELPKQEIVFKIMQAQTEQSGMLFGQGVLEILPDGWGFLRRNRNFSPDSEDIYVSQSQIKRFGLKTGDTVSGQVRPPKDSEKYYGLLRVEGVNGMDPE